MHLKGQMAGKEHETGKQAYATCIASMENDVRYHFALSSGGLHVMSGMTRGTVSACGWHMHDIQR